MEKLCEMVGKEFSKYGHMGKREEIKYLSPFSGVLT
jgi:hypothetical protein